MKLIMCEDNTDTKNWNELNREQQEYVLNNWKSMPSLYSQLFNEYRIDEQDNYLNDILYPLVDEYEEQYGLQINLDAISYFLSDDSTWEAEELFNTVTKEDSNGDQYTITFVGQNSVKAFTDYSYTEDGETYEEYGIPTSELTFYGVPQNMVKYIKNLARFATKFVKDLRAGIQYIYTSEPDRDWVESYLDTVPQDFQFTVLSDGTIDGKYTG